MDTDEAVPGLAGVQDPTSKGNAGDAIPGLDPGNLIVDPGDDTVRPGLHRKVTEHGRPGQGVDPHQVSKNDLRGNRQGQQLHEYRVECLGVVGDCGLNCRKQREVKPNLPVEGKQVQYAGRHYYHVGRVNQVMGESSPPELAGGGVPNISLYNHEMYNFIENVYLCSKHVNTTSRSAKSGQWPSV